MVVKGTVKAYLGYRNYWSVKLCNPGLYILLTNTIKYKYIKHFKCFLQHVIFIHRIYVSTYIQKETLKYSQCTFFLRSTIYFFLYF